MLEVLRKIFARSNSAPRLGVTHRAQHVDVGQARCRGHHVFVVSLAARHRSARQRELDLRQLARELERAARDA